MFIGERLLKKDHVTPKGDIPAYSTNVFAPFVHTDKSNIIDFSVPYVLWGIDGNFLFNAIPARTEFATTDHCGAIRIKSDSIDPQFLAYMLGEVKHLYGFDRGLRASLINMRRIEFNIPVDEYGDFDIESQKIISGQFALVNQMKSELTGWREQLTDLHFVVDIGDYQMRALPLTDCFDIVRGSGKYTKTYTQTHVGEYPLYSGNTFAAFADIDSCDFNVPCLSWTIDGLAGYMMIHTSPFSATNHRGVLIPKSNKINLVYAKHILEPIFRELKKGRIGENGKNEYTSLPPFMLESLSLPCPVDENGEISLSAQQKIAKSYATIEMYRREVLDRIDSLIAQPISYCCPASPR
ncbi:MAG: restriction endonuclease subunit S [Clostridiales Family XIII bacterium]|nr:restriction endonuclease subunit S [Clostridiales Family XIII bacterium]